MSVSVKFPFQVSNGVVATTTLDREAVRSKLMFCLGTQVNERVMRPSWGIDIMNTVYAVGADLDEAIPEAIAEMFRRWFPSYTLIEALVEQDPKYPTHASVTVRYGDIDSGVDEVLRQELPIQEQLT